MADDVNVHPDSADGWRATLLAHRQVVNVRLGQEIGHVADVVFDPGARQLTGLLLEPAGRERAVSEIARRVFGGTVGLTYVDLERVIALHADVVTADLDAAVSPADRAGVQRTRLNAVLGFAVVTIKGQKLGRLADLVLDAAGRHVLAYLVEPNVDAGSGNHIRARGATSTGSQAPDRPEASTAGTPHAPKAGQAAFLTVPASQDVRIGRDLIIIAGGHDAGAPGGSTSGARHIAARPNEGAPRRDAPDASTRHHGQPSAPPERRQP